MIQNTIWTIYPYALVMNWKSFFIDIYCTFKLNVKLGHNYFNYPYFTPIQLNLTRLLGRPQLQMYPPVALNQYTWVNRTHKHFLYMLQGPCKSWNRFHSKAILQQHVNYGSNLMKFVINFFLIGGGGVLGNRMLNPEVLRCHEDLITLET